MPPLCERLDDVPILTDYFMKALSTDLEKPMHGITDEARAVLQNHSWPGNVRELNNAIRYAIVQSTGGVITEGCLPPSCLSGQSAGRDESLPLENDKAQQDVRSLVRHLLASGSRDIYREVGKFVDQVVLSEVLQSTSGNQFQAADRLGLSRVTLRAKLRGINDRKNKE